MSNPNNCETCNHRQHREDGQGGHGHCYMFRMAPTSACVHHTFSVEQWKAMRMQFGEAILTKVTASVAAQAKEQ